MNIRAFKSSKRGQPASHGGNNNVLTMAAAEATNDWQTSRTRIASEMASHIHREVICPTKLSTVVTSSGLVMADLLCAACKTQALRYEKYEHCRGAYSWTPCRFAYNACHDVEHYANEKDLVCGYVTNHSRLIFSCGGGDQFYTVTIRRCMF